MMAAEKARKSERIQKGELTEFLSKQRLNLLLTLFLALCAIFLFLLRTTPEGQRWLASWQAQRNTTLSQQRFQEALKNDPSLGFPLEKVGIANLSWNQLPVLLVVLGRCEGCNEKVVFEWMEMGEWKTLRESVWFVLVLQEGAKKVEEIEEKAKGVSLVADERGEIVQRLNAFFVPRSYGFVDGKLVWIQKRVKLGVVEVLENFLSEVKGSEEAKQLMNAWAAEMRERAWGKRAGFIKGGDKR